MPCLPCIDLMIVLFVKNTQQPEARIHISVTPDMPEYTQGLR